MSWPRLLADLIVVLHFAYVAFVVFGLVAILIGLALRRNWARNFWFRVLHLAMILLVVAEAWLGIICPLTTWEQTLRRMAGETVQEGTFLGYWAHRLIFFRAPPWVFTLIYTLFGLLVVATFVFAPPRRPGRRRTTA
ncbi:MAG: DUF2784 domain-containing protein [Isosphaeraceae bacterium]|nr:DUF2784 domain-containing protein [Isosphaeraceae bacterium]